MISVLQKSVNRWYRTKTAQHEHWRRRRPIRRILDHSWRSTTSIFWFDWTLVIDNHALAVHETKPNQQQVPVLLYPYSTLLALTSSTVSSFRPAFHQKCVPAFSSLAFSAPSTVWSFFFTKKLQQRSLPQSPVHSKTQAFRCHAVKNTWSWFCILPTVEYEFNKRNFIVRSLFNYVRFCLVLLVIV